MEIMEVWLWWCDVGKLKKQRCYQLGNRSWLLRRCSFSLCTTSQRFSLLRLNFNSYLRPTPLLLTSTFPLFFLFFSCDSSCFSSFILLSFSPSSCLWFTLPFAFFHPVITLHISPLFPLSSFILYLLGLSFSRLYCYSNRKISLCSSLPLFTLYTVFFLIFIISFPSLLPPSFTRSSQFSCSFLPLSLHFCPLFSGCLLFLSQLLVSLHDVAPWFANHLFWGPEIGLTGVLRRSWR